MEHSPHQPDASFDLSPIWSLIEYVANDYERRRRHLGSSKLLRNGQSTHLPGLAGQVGVALITGQPTMLDPLIGGDGGSDIADVDIKTTTYWPPILKHPLNAPRWPRWFGLAHLSADHVVTYIGTVSADDLTGQRSYVRTFNEGAGEQHCLDADAVRTIYADRRARRTSWIAKQ